MYIHWRYGRIQLPAVIRPLYPAYISLKLLFGLPTFSGSYLLTVLRGARSALKGELIPYERAGGEVAGIPPPAGRAVAPMELG
jgi:hypothetical protein